MVCPFFCFFRHYIVTCIDTSLGKSIGGTLIPLLTQIRERHPIILRYIFPTELLEPGESRDLDFTDLVATQRILDYLKLQ